MANKPELTLTKKDQFEPVENPIQQKKEKLEITKQSLTNQMDPLMMNFQFGNSSQEQSSVFHSTIPLRIPQAQCP